MFGMALVYKKANEFVKSLENAETAAEPLSRAATSLLPLYHC